METSESEAALDSLIPETCWVLLGQKHLGRIAVADDGDIHVLPVNYTLVQGRIIMRSGSHSILRGAVPCRATLEVDDIDEPARRGWSVSVKGALVNVTDQAPEDPQLVSLELDTWAPGTKPLVIELQPTNITGRYLYPTPGVDSSK
jgi:nitroimidazol reductase NimA-like FMN-containing flavoprotein (pyridoxamine 5'-phosphate oxidase superfamily)